MTYQCLICDRIDYHMAGDVCSRCEEELNAALVEMLLVEAFTTETGAGSGRDRSTFYFSD